MARTQESTYSPKVAKKAFREKAKQEGITFRAAAEARAKEMAEQKIFRPAAAVRRNPGRMDGSRWNGRTFICSREVDDGMSHFESEDHLDDEGYHEWAPEERLVVSLLDIARPAKLRGVAKEFVLVDGMRHVIALEDDEGALLASLDEDEEWEEVHEESHGGLTEKSYSAALRGSGG